MSTTPIFQRVKRGTSSSSGFTLIELLIVIAIILILVAIALPNFLEAQIRARVTKTRGDLRSIGIAMESYYLDWKIYPSESENNPFARSRSEQGVYWLTTPIAYMTSIPNDPFGEQALGEEITVYESGGCEAGITFPQCQPCMRTWAFFSLGPSGDTQVVSDHPHYGVPGDGSVDAYSATNGTKSAGDIFIWGGDAFWIGVSSQFARMDTYKAANGTLDIGLVVNGQFYLHRLPPNY